MALRNKTTIIEAARKSGVDQSKISYHIRCGKIDSEQVGQTTYVSLDQVVSYFKNYLKKKQNDIRSIKIPSESKAKDHYTIAECARMLNLNSPNIFRYIDSLKISTAKRGHKTLISYKDLCLIADRKIRLGSVKHYEFQTYNVVPANKVKKEDSITLTDICKEYGLSKLTATRLVKRSKAPVYYHGRKVNVSRSAFKSWEKSVPKQEKTWGVSKRRGQNAVNENSFTITLSQDVAPVLSMYVSTKYKQSIEEYVTAHLNQLCESIIKRTKAG